MKFLRKFEEAYRLIMQSLIKQGSGIWQSMVSTSQYRSSINQFKKRYRFVDQLLDDFKQKGFMIGRAYQIKQKDIYDCYFGGQIQFGDIIVVWKNLNNLENPNEKYWFCLQHFCQIFNINKDRLLKAYLASVGQKSEKMPEFMAAIYDNIKNATEAIASRWDRDYGFPVERPYTTFCGSDADNYDILKIKNIIANSNGPKESKYQIYFQLNGKEKIITEETKDISKIIVQLNNIFNIIRSNFSLKDANKIIQKMKKAKYYSSSRDSYYDDMEHILIASIYLIQTNARMRFMILENGKLLSASKAKLLMQSWFNLQN